MKAARSVPKRLFWVKHVRPTRIREPRPCDQGWHKGPLRDTARFDIAGGVWSGTGCCAACGSHIHRSQIRVPA